MPSAGESGRKVLVVDDEPLVLESLGLLLDQTWTVLSARSAAEARELLRDNDVLVMVTDERMPGGSGVELLEWAREHSPATIRILLTGYADVATLDRAINQGKVWHFLRKPWSNAEILGLLERAYEYRMARQQLAQSERRYRELFRNAHAGIFRASSDGTLEDGNNALARAVGLEDPAALVGLRLGDLFEQGDQWSLVRTQLERERSVDNVDVTLRRSGGGSAVGLLSASLHRDQAELHIEGSFVDLSAERRVTQEREELQQRLHRLQRLDTVGALAGGIAHDLNNLLSVILSCASFIESAPDSPDRQECFSDLKAAVKRSSDLTAQLLRYVRGGSTHSEATSLNVLVDNVAKLLSRAASKKIVVQPSLDPALRSIHGVAGQLYQCVLNLAINACDAMSDGGRLTLRTRNEGPAHVVLEIVDTGSGIPDQVLPHIFEPFFTTKAGQPGSGTGLGLAVVRDIVQRHAGTISVESSSGQGTRFVLRFPSMGGEAGSREVVRPRYVEGQEVVVLVDDEPTVRKLCAAYLGQRGYAVLTGANGVDAVRLVEQNEQIEAVILDSIMPVMDGEEAHRRIRALRPTLPILLLTGHLVGAQSRALLDDPHVHVLGKPFANDELGAALRTALAGPAATRTG